MQPPTEPNPAAPTTTRAPRGDEDELYRSHHRDLERAVARVVNAPRELIEDACQNAWAILLRNQPDRCAIFAWLRVVAIHEAYRLSAIDRRDAHLERLTTDNDDWQESTADPRSLDDILEAREALRVLADLPERQHTDLALLVAGHSYREIAEITGGRTFVSRRPRSPNGAGAAARLDSTIRQPREAVARTLPEHLHRRADLLAR